VTLPGISGDGPTRTDMHCHDCNAGFVAELDFSISGEHVVECPRCGHEHCRIIQDGEITEERWTSRNDDQPKIRGRSFWKSDVLPARTSIAAQYLRQSWLNRTGE